MKKITVKMHKTDISLEVDRKEFSLALKTWRLRQGLTQQQVAQQFGCSRYTIMRAEAAKAITWEMAYRLFAMLSKELEKEK